MNRVCIALAQACAIASSVLLFTGAALQFATRLKSSLVTRYRDGLVCLESGSGAYAS